jgi:hypothetical protein
MELTQSSEDLNGAADRARATEVLPFYAVSVTKLVLLSLATFTIYETFWFYKNWKTIKASTGRNISPFWRAVFSPIYCFALAKEVNEAAKSKNLLERISPAIITVFYAGMIALERAPEPYGYICLLSFIPLILIAHQIHRVHQAIRPGFNSNVGWGFGACSTLAVGGALGCLLLAVALGPSGRALRGLEIPNSHETTLVKAGVLEPAPPTKKFNQSK